MSPRRLGMFGGAFDPPHVGHRIVALDACERLELDRLFIVPTPLPPHRETVFPARRRLQFTRRVFEEDPGVEVSDIEYGIEGPSYTVETLGRLRASDPDAQFWLIIGSDQYSAFDTWHRPDEVIELARLAVMERAGVPIDGDPRFPFRRLEVTRVDVSGEMIRGRIAAGQSIRYLVPDCIREEVERDARQLTGYTKAC